MTNRKDARKPKRRNGAGSVRQRNSNLWEARLTIAHRPNGSAIQRSYYGPTEDQAAAAMEADRVRRGVGIDLTSGNLTVSEYLATWLRSRRQSIEPETWKRYEQLIRLQIVPHIGERRLAKLTAENVEQMFAELAGALSPRTILHVRACLRTALNRAIERGYLLRNAAALADIPAVRARKGRTLRPDQVALLLRVICDDRYENICRVALGTLLRQGEVLGLRQGDVDLEQGIVHVSAQVHAGRVKDHPKTEQSERLVGLTPLAIEAIRNELADRVDRQAAAGDAWHDADSLIFTTDTGRPIDATAVTKHLHRLMTDAGLPWITFHGLRHTANSLLHSIGIDQKTRSVILGHADIRTTEQIYTHVLPETMRDATNRYGQMLARLDGQLDVGTARGSGSH
jgi:integrase